MSFINYFLHSSLKKSNSNKVIYKRRPLKTHQLILEGSIFHVIKFPLTRIKSHQNKNTRQIKPEMNYSTFYRCYNKMISYQTPK